MKQLREASASLEREYETKSFEFKYQLKSAEDARDSAQRTADARLIKITQLEMELKQLHAIKDSARTRPITPTPDIARLQTELGLTKSSLIEQEQKNKEIEAAVEDRVSQFEVIAEDQRAEIQDLQQKLATFRKRFAAERDHSNELLTAVEDLYQIAKRRPG